MVFQVVSIDHNVQLYTLLNRYVHSGGPLHGSTLQEMVSSLTSRKVLHIRDIASQRPFGNSLLKFNRIGGINQNTYVKLPDQLSSKFVTLNPD